MLSTLNTVPNLAKRVARPLALPGTPLMDRCSYYVEVGIIDWTCTVIAIEPWILPQTLDCAQSHTSLPLAMGYQSIARWT